MHMHKEKLKPSRPNLFFDFSHTILFSICILVLGIVSTHLFARKLHPEQFGQFQLARRLVNYSFPLFIFGLNTALVRQISFYQDINKKRALQLAALIISVAGCILALIIAALFDKQISYFIFNNSRGGKELLYLIIAVIGFTYQYATFRATYRLFWANVLLILVMGIIPLLVAYLIQPHIDAFVLIKKLAKWTCVPTVLIILFVAFKRELRELITGYRQEGAWEPVKELVGYGIKRMPVPLLLGIIYSGGAVALNNNRAYEAAGYFLAALFLMRILEQSVGPIAVVMLPRLSENAGHQDNLLLRKYSMGVLDCILAIGIFVSLEAMILGKQIIHLMFGRAYDPATMAFRILAVGIVPVLYFSLTQTIIDAFTEKGVVLVAVLSGAVISIIGFVILRADTAAEVALIFVVSITVTSSIMHLFLLSALNLPTIPEDLGKLAACNISAAILCHLTLKLLVKWSLYPYWIILISVLVSGLFYLFLSAKLNLMWTNQLQKGIRFKIRKNLQ